MHPTGARRVDAERMETARRVQTAGRQWAPGRPIDLSAQLGPLRRGSGDPTWGSTADGGIWRTTLTPVGPGLERLIVNRSAGVVEARAWGPGANWLMDRVPRLLGQLDNPGDFQPPGVLRQTGRRHQGWRVGRTERVLEALLPAILEQRVTGGEAWRAWRLLINDLGEPAPHAPGAPAGLRVFPAPEAWQAVPSWKWHKLAVDGKRSAAILRAAQLADQLEDCLELSAADARVRLHAIHGIGIWTVAETAQRALGDPDAISYQDYHLAREVVFVMSGERNGDDAQMAKLLLPWAGHRYRIQRLIELSGKQRPRHGPRITIHNLSNF